MSKHILHTLLILWLFFICSESRSQVEKTIEIADSGYVFIDPDYELLLAASEGDTNKIKAFLALGVDVDTRDWEGVTPLMFAAQNGHLRAVEILIDAGADVNTRPYNYLDALLGATIAGHVLVVDTLILNGANVNTRSLDGVTPLMYAAAYDHYLLCDVLIYYGTQMNSADNFGNTPLHFSAFYGNLEIVQLLVEKGAEKEASDVDGFTPLMCAAQNGHLPVVVYLLEAGCDIHKTNDQNCDALALAIINRFYGIADFLLTRGADANRLIAKKINPYELAREFGGKEMTSLVQSYGGAPLHKYNVNKLVTHFEMNWNNKDLMIGGSVGLIESIHGWEAELGYLTRPAVRSVRYRADDQTSYQFWEKRSLVYLGAGKRFTLASPQAKETFGAFASANAGYTYGSFRGSAQKPGDDFVIIPRGGLFYNYKALSVKLSYEYFNIKNSEVSPHRLTLSAGAIFNLIRWGQRPKREPRL